MRLMRPGRGLETRMPRRLAEVSTRRNRGGAPTVTPDAPKTAAERGLPNAADWDCSWLR